LCSECESWSPSKPRIASRLNVQILQRLGYPNTDIAHDGVEAVEMSLDKAYDIILMDVNMPQKDGLQATIEYDPNQREGSS
jgi:CheY-like chemotaxis protein